MTIQYRGLRHLRSTNPLLLQASALLCIIITTFKPGNSINIDVSYQQATTHFHYSLSHFFITPHDTISPNTIFTHHHLSLNTPYLRRSNRSPHHHHRISYNHACPADRSSTTTNRSTCFTHTLLALWHPLPFTDPTHFDRALTSNTSVTHIHLVQIYEKYKMHPSILPRSPV